MLSLIHISVVGERDSQFNHVDANAQGKNNVTEYISADHPLYSEIFSQYSAIELSLIHISPNHRCYSQSSGSPDNSSPFR